MKKFKLEDLNIEKANVHNIYGGIKKCCIQIPTNGIASYGAASGDWPASETTGKND